MKKIGQIQAKLFEDHLIISFDKKWLEVFHSLPSFSITIDDQNRLCLKSQSIQKSGGNSV